MSSTIYIIIGYIFLLLFVASIILAIVFGILLIVDKNKPKNKTKKVILIVSAISIPVSFIALGLSGNAYNEAKTKEMIILKIRTDAKEEAKKEFRGLDEIIDYASFTGGTLSGLAISYSNSLNDSTNASFRTYINNNQRALDSVQDYINQGRDKIASIKKIKLYDAKETKKVSKAIKYAEQTLNELQDEKDYIATTTDDIETINKKNEAGAGIGDGNSPAYGQKEYKALIK